jgi:3-dehydroquinate synthetase
MPEASIITVPVPLGDRAYDIHVGRGLLGEAGRRIAALGTRAVAIVTDEHVGPLYAEALATSLQEQGLSTVAIAVPPGEATKSYAGLEQVCDAILAAKIERGDLVAALGGGVVGDLAGFAAAVVRRGVRFVQLPTTLLSQVDSSVGGKTGINSRHGKNLVGAFHQPSLVLADTALLDTLPVREMRVAHPPPPKAAVVVRDEREDGDRALLNLGHTFGHALERITRYDSARLVHGEGVAIGLAQAFRFSAFLGLCEAAEAERVEAHLTATGLPTRLSQVPGGCGTVDALLDAMAQDKKVKGGALTFILARGIGQSFVARDVPVERVRVFLQDETSPSRS